MYVCRHIHMSWCPALKNHLVYDHTRLSTYIFNEYMCMRMNCAWCTVQSTCNVSLDGNHSWTTTRRVTCDHPPSLEFSRASLRVNTLESSEHSHALVLANKCVSVMEWFLVAILMHMPLERYVCWNLKWRCVYKPRVPTYSS